MDDPLDIRREEHGESRTMIDKMKDKKTILVAVLLTVNLLNYMDRFTIAGVLPRLQSYFEMDDKQSGMLQTMFILFYLVAAPICGVAGDRYERKRIMAIGLSIWIFAVTMSSFVGRENYILFLLLRGLVGVGEASYSTVAPTIIADAFAGPTRSMVLMVFYFAIPVGSGLGYIGGAYVSLWFGEWQWGIRFTPLLGLICLVLIVFVLEEPQRGEAEHATQAPPSPKSLKSVWEDMEYILTVPTYRYTTLGSTAVVFAVGALSWWTPTLICHAYAVLHGTSVVPESEKANIALIFGLITAAAGLVGVTVGSTVAQAWHDGRWGLPASHRAEAVVCGVGALLGVPLLFACLIAASHYISVAWFLMFIAVTCMCLNWAINMDILMNVIVANRRATATAMQTMFAHLFGDAASPYIVGVISDWVRDNDESSTGRFFALRAGLFLPNFILIAGGALYLYSSFYVVEDTKTAKHVMHVPDDEDSTGGDDVQVLVRD